ncbi:MAG TPA: hypothetical protein VJP02_21130 [Candidatus Sulfotelmatobacter sp.]|nr:hypothetical protein [Candidatus Sulfotelmatobacter sp.]
MNTEFPWQNTYLEAVLETDTSRLVQRIVAAENAIKTRVTELEKDHQGTREERTAIADALNGLAILRKERISD